MPRIASGSKRSSAATFGLQVAQHPGDPLLRGEPGGLVDGADVDGLVGHQVERQVEAARLQQLDERVQAGSDGVALPACDLGAVLADSVAELGLAQAGPQTGLADEAAAQRHERVAIESDMVKGD